MDDASGDGRSPDGSGPRGPRYVRRVRQVRYPAFLVTGGALGILVGLLLGSGGGGVTTDGAVYSAGSVTGYLAVLGALFGTMLGGVVALVLDALQRRRARG